MLVEPKPPPVLPPPNKPPPVLPLNAGLAAVEPNKPPVAVLLFAVLPNPPNPLDPPAVAVPPPKRPPPLVVAEAPKAGLFWPNAVVFEGAEPNPVDDVPATKLLLAQAQ